MPSDAALHELTAELGPDSVFPGAEADARHTTPARGRSAGRAAAVVCPESTAEVSAVVRWAVRHRCPLVVQGANTGLVGASTPDAGGHQVVLSLHRLQAIREVDPVDRIVIAEAGVRLSALRAALAPHDLVVPIDLGADPTVGGLVAANAGGARTLRDGDVRRRVLGLEVVIADSAGTVVRDLRALRKDSSRLNPRELLVGSDGALGVVTAAALEAAPRPRRTATALGIPHSPAGALDLLLALERRLGPQLAAFEAMSAGAVRAAVDHVPAATNPFPGPPPALAVLIEVSDPTPGEPLEGRLAEVLSEVADAHPDALVDAVVTPPAVAWRLRHSLTEGLTRRGPVLTFDLSVRRSALPTLWREVRQLAAERFPDAEVEEFGHWGDGGVHLYLCYPPGAAAVTDVAAGAAVRRAVYRLVDDLGGSFSAEHGLGPLNAAAYHELVPAPQRRLAALVKRALDPHGLLGTPPHLPEPAPIQPDLNTPITVPHSGTATYPPGAI